MEEGMWKRLEGVVQTLPYQEADWALVEIGGLVLAARVPRGNLLLVDELLDRLIIPLATRVEPGGFCKGGFV
jgi:hypothetical protein